MKRLISLTLTILFSLSGLLTLSACARTVSSTQIQATSSATPVVYESDDYTALLARIKLMYENQTQQNERYYTYKGSPLMPGATIAMAESADRAAGQDATVSQDNSSQMTTHSETNIQVAGVDEADIIKTDGRFIYAVINNQLNIIDAADPAAMRQAATIKFSTSGEPATGNRNENVLEMYLDPALQRLVLIVSGYDVYSYKSPSAPETSAPATSGPVNDDQDTVASDSVATVQDPSASRKDPLVSTESMPELVAPDQVMPEMIAPIQVGRNYTMTLVYSIQDPYNPVEIRRFAQEGSYVSSRRINEHVYIVSQKYQMQYEPVPADELEIFPKISETGTSDFKVVRPRQVALVESGDPSVQVVLAALDIKDTGKPANLLAVLGSSGTVYASADYLYLFGYQMTWDKDGQWAESKTVIYRYGLDAGTLTKAGQGAVRGNVLNQFSLDEYKGYLRVATTSGENWNRSQTMVNNLFVLDQDLKTVGSVTGLAKNEIIRSVRFLGDRGYIVTFRTTDPLFVIDLQDPANPYVTGELKIPGYSAYLHLWQKDRLLGIGYDAAVEGDRAFEKGLKVSLFDIANPANPREISTLLLGSRGSSTVLNSNHKALIADPVANILAFPALLAKTSSQSPLEYGQPYFQGLVVINIFNDKIQLKGGISHIDRNLNQGDQGRQPNGDDVNRFYGYDQVLRGAFIGDVLFTLSSHEIQASRMADLKAISSLELPGSIGESDVWGTAIAR